MSNNRQVLPRSLDPMRRVLGKRLLELEQKVEQLQANPSTSSNLTTVEVVTGPTSTTVNSFYPQTTASTTWTVTHNLDTYPNVLVIADDGSVIYGDVTYDNTNQLTIEFSAPVQGTAYLIQRDTMLPIKFDSEINLLEHALRNALLDPLAADPSPVLPEGHVYYNTTSDEIRISNGTAYIAPGGSMTAAQILSALLTVDGSGSLLDADLLDGQEASSFAPSSHTHVSTDITDFNAASAAIAQAIVDGVVGVAPAALDTLQEIATAINNDPDVFNTLNNLINAKPSKFSLTIGDGAATAITVNHNLNTQDVAVSIREVATNEAILANWVATDVNNITVSFGEAPLINEYRVTVVG